PILVRLAAGATQASTAVPLLPRSFFATPRRPPRPTPFPYTTLFRSPVIAKFGTEQQKRRFLPGICSGELSFCIGMSEPDSGSDLDRKSTRLNSSHVKISYAVFCLKKKNGRPCSTPPRERRASWWARA